jgi:hypothetical protein
MGAMHTSLSILAQWFHRTALVSIAVVAWEQYASGHGWIESKAPTDRGGGEGVEARHEIERRGITKSTGF